MPAAFVEPAIERPTGSMWGRPPGAVAWIASTRLTAKPSKTSTSIRWSATRSTGYAAGPPGKQIRMKQVISARHSARHARNVESHMDRLGPALRFQVTLNHRAQYAHQNVCARVSSRTPMRMNRKMTDIVPCTPGRFTFIPEARRARAR